MSIYCSTVEILDRTPVLILSHNFQTKRACRRRHDQEDDRIFPYDPPHWPPVTVYYWVYMPLSRKCRRKSFTERLYNDTPPSASRVVGPMDVEAVEIRQLRADAVMTSAATAIGCPVGRISTASTSVGPITREAEGGVSL